MYSFVAIARGYGRTSGMEQPTGVRSGGIGYGLRSTHGRVRERKKSRRGGSLCVERSMASSAPQCGSARGCLLICLRFGQRIFVHIHDCPSPQGGGRVCFTADTRIPLSFI